MYIKTIMLIANLFLYVNSRWHKCKKYHNTIQPVITTTIEPTFIQPVITTTIESTLIQQVITTTIEPTLIQPVITTTIEPKFISLEDSSRYWTGSSCNTGGTHSVNEFGANICEYPGDTCPIVKYFEYPGGGNGVELCCDKNSDCNYNPIKNYCHPDYKRCTNGFFFNCSEKGGPIFESCL